MVVATHRLSSKSFESIKSHKAINHALFDYLKRRARTKDFSAAFFNIYRVNYFTRTQGIASAISEILKAAVEEADYLTISLVGMNLFEETGEGDPKKTHLMLLEKSHNKHGELIFGLPPIPVKMARYSEHALKSFQHFPEDRMHLYSNNSYFFRLGVMLADETAAVPMISGFYKSLFEPYKDDYAEEDLQGMTRYFSDHLSGVEQRHGDDMLSSVQGNCKTNSDIDEVMYGAECFFKMQSNLWDALLTALESVDTK